MKNNIIKLYDTYEEINKGRKTNSFITKDVGELFTHHGQLGVLQQWKWLLEDLTSLEAKLKCQRKELKDRRKRLRNKSNEITELKQQFAEKEKKFEEVKNLKAKELGEALSCAIEKLTDIISQKLDTATLLDIAQRNNQDKIEFAVAELEKVKDIVNKTDKGGYIIHFASLDDRLMFYKALDNQINLLKEIKNE